MDRIVSATYVTKWNGGRTTVEKSCGIDVIERKILNVSDKEKITGPYDDEHGFGKDDRCDGVYVVMPDGTEYPVVWDGFFNGYVVCGGKKGCRSSVHWRRYHWQVSQIGRQC